ncbi:MAG: PTS system mannose/fructose/sorbose family transporter subunit IID [Deltaproteobacteria bacterium]|nr:PTS system mannose/fructose/sorbose family transporter subunit IID [Deltaproteobacteria bacterium]
MVSKYTMLRVFLGSFFIQSAWSFEKMQGLGFAAAISPALREIYGDDEKAGNDAVKRHLVYYNAHPYMASPVIGAVMRLEEKARDGERTPPAPAEFKNKVMGPYGAIGDSFFWSGLRPLASCAGVAATILWGIWGPVIFLAVYNTFHLWMRWNGLKKGYALGEGVVGYIKGLDLPGWSIRARYAASAILGVLVASAAASIPASAGRGHAAGWAVAAVIIISGAAFLLSLSIKKGVSISAVIYAVAIPLIVYGAVSGF